MRMASGLQFVSDGTNGSSPDPGTGSCVVARIDRTGNLRLLNARGVEDWKPEFELTGSSSKPLGGVAVGTNSIVYVGNDGRMAVAFGWGQLWHPGVTIGDPCAPPGAGGGVMQQTAGLLTAGVIGNDGRIWLSWVVLGQNWNGPVPFGDPVGVPGGAIALGKQNSDVGVAVFIGTDRRMWVASVDGTNGWNAAVPFGNPVAPPGAPVALGASSNGLIALVVGDDSRMNVAWVADNNPWQGPVSFGQPIAQPGADITCLGSSAAVIGSDGRPYYAFAGPKGGPWQGPAPIGPSVGRPGCAVCLASEVSTFPLITRIVLVVANPDDNISWFWNGVGGSLSGWNAIVSPEPRLVARYLGPQSWHLKLTH